MPTTEYKEQNIQRVIKIAEKCFIKYGIEETSHVILAKESGLTTRSISRYFASKKDLVIRVISDVVKRHIQQKVSQFESYRASNHTGLEELLYWIDINVRRCDTDIDLFSIFNEAYSFFKHHDILFDEYVRRELSVLSQVNEVRMAALTKGVKDGSIRPDLDVRRASAFIHISVVGMVQQFAMYTTEKEFISNYFYTKKEMTDVYLKMVEQNLKKI